MSFLFSELMDRWQQNGEFIAYHSSHSAVECNADPEWKMLPVTDDDVQMSQQRSKIQTLLIKFAKLNLRSCILDSESCCDGNRRYFKCRISHDAAVQF